MRLLLVFLAVLAAAVLAAAVLALAGCGGADETTPGSTSPPPDQSAAAGSCAMQLVYEGRTYVGYGTTTPPAPGRRLGTAEVPPCMDTPGIEAGEASQVDVRAVPGVDPELAVADGESLYVRADADPGTFPDALSELLQPAG
jgi:hypothetical protein